eukprot:CAMPEP_0177603086 /NCGR_PEP_ID=MMETSP0419_2-20121207/15296_1 /TAXON_ID=582737 /ORGANISM="Tetraselmis sp., Strain GSL018" /LENGTH=483 /DNA_ID=CAMNT_0019096777 /DNA_START=206 /DNA_END=1657 /DNA_ORIENTATION=+
MCRKTALQFPARFLAACSVAADGGRLLTSAVPQPGATGERCLSGRGFGTFRSFRKFREGMSGLLQSRPCSTSAKRSDSDSLTSIKGVGEKTAEVLREVGIPDKTSLRSWYESFSGLEQKVVEQSLRDHVRTGTVRNGSKKGVTLRKPAVEALVGYLVDSREEAPARGSSSRPAPSLTLCVEGNIGVGKTTFLQKLIGKSLELQEVVEVVPEPVEKWQDVGAGHVNLLDLFYQDQKRYAYTFQHYVFVTRMLQERDSRARLQSAGQGKTLRLLERSVFSDRMVFVRAVHEAKCMSDAELSVYDSWFSPMLQAIPTLVPDGFIYLRADPRTCLSRMLGRSRAEESAVSIEYLESLHQKHEEWIRSSSSPCFREPQLLLPQSEAPPTTLSYAPHDSPAVPQRLRDKVVHMRRGGGLHIPVELDSVPALVLEYDSQIDVENDPEAQREYATQVKEYMEYIKLYKESLAQQTLLVPQVEGRRGLIHAP